MVTHTKENNLKCEICEKKFIRKSSVKAHMLVHTKVKDFQCEFCQKKLLILKKMLSVKYVKKALLERIT